MGRKDGRRVRKNAMDNGGVKSVFQMPRYFCVNYHTTLLPPLTASNFSLMRLTCGPAVAVDSVFIINTSSTAPTARLKHTAISYLILHYNYNININYDYNIVYRGNYQF